MEVQIQEHEYPDTLGTFARPAPLISGILLGETPQYFASNFQCSCGRSLYDGGLCQPVFCTCGTWQQRSEDGTIRALQAEPKIKCQSKGFLENLNLKSITFGVFSETIAYKYKLATGVDYQKILLTLIKPYFLMHLRCIESGIIFIYKDTKFKVLSCYPRQGFVSSSSRLHLYSQLSSGSISSVEVIPLPPHRINEELFDSIFLPYFIAGDVHLHSSQHVCIFGLECVVSKTESENGFVVPGITEFNYCEYPIPPIVQVSLVPYIEDIPNYLTRVSDAELSISIMNMYIMPFLKGWRRVIKVGMVIEIGGIDFKVRNCMPDGGVTDENTVISYNGSVTSRRRNRDPAEVQRLRELVKDLEGAYKEKQENIRKIQEFTLQVIPENPDQRNCIICLMDFEKGSKIRTFPCCNPYSGHIFHKDCSERWLIRNLTCPTCKTHI